VKYHPYLVTKGLLFLCVANSARSQMAEALARAHFGDSIRVQSAGSEPSVVNPFALEVLFELSVDTKGLTSKSVDVIDPSTVDVVVTLCAEEVCPVILGSAKRIHWPLPDPALAGVDDLSRERILDRFRETRDAIASRLDELAVALG
jgi:arsenate reductase